MRGGLPRGECLPRESGVSARGMYTSPLWTEFLSHGCENITFLQLRLRTVTRKHSSRMRTAHLLTVSLSIPYISLGGICPTILGCRPPPGCRRPWMQNPLGCRCPMDADPLVMWPVMVRWETTPLVARQTPVKTLPFPKLRLRQKRKLESLSYPYLTNGFSFDVFLFERTWDQPVDHVLGLMVTHLGSASRPCTPPPRYCSVVWPSFPECWNTLPPCTSVKSKNKDRWLNF